MVIAGVTIKHGHDEVNPDENSLRTTRCLQIITTETLSGECEAAAAIQSPEGLQSRQLERHFATLARSRHKICPKPFTKLMPCRESNPSRRFAL
jgi:hypothetical protein